MAWGSVAYDESDLSGEVFSELLNTVVNPHPPCGGRTLAAISPDADVKSLRTAGGGSAGHGSGQAGKTQRIVMSAEQPAYALAACDRLNNCFSPLHGLSGAFDRAAAPASANNEDIAARVMAAPMAGELDLNGVGEAVGFGECAHPAPERADGSLIVSAPDTIYGAGVSPPACAGSPAFTLRPEKGEGTAPVTLTTPYSDPQNGVDAVITLSWQRDASGFQIARREVSVSPDLAEKYGFPDSFEGEEVSVLDAVIAAHVALLGGDAGIITSAVSLGESGMLTNFMGDGSGAFIYLVNGEVMDLLTGECRLNGGDVLELFSVQDPGYLDTLAWFESDGKKTESVQIPAGRPLELTVRGVRNVIFGEGSGAKRADVEDAGIVPVETSGAAGVFGSPLTVSDSAGAVRVTFHEAGVYIMSAVDTAYCSPLMSPWLVVTVTGEAPALRAGKTALAGIIASASGKDEAAFTEGSRSGFEEAPACAKAVLGDESASQSEACEAEGRISASGEALPTKPGVSAAQAAVSRIVTRTPNPAPGDEWAVIAAARAGRADSDDPWAKKYLASLNSALLGGDDESLRTKADWARAAIAVGALGLDATAYKANARTYDLTEAFRTFSPCARIHDDILAAIALGSGDCGGYARRILSLQKTDGSWSRSGMARQPGSFEMTAMAVQALAPRCGEPGYAVRASIDGAVTWLKKNVHVQNTAQGVARFISALTSAGQDPGEDAPERLMSFYDAETGAFSLKAGGPEDRSCTQQAAIALIACSLFRGTT